MTINFNEFPNFNKFLTHRSTVVNFYDFKCGRFDERGASLSLLEEVMSLCNDAVVYLEQIRDIYVENVDTVVLNDIIKEYIYSRRKIFNLYKAWRKFQAEYGKRTDGGI